MTAPGWWVVTFPGHRALREGGGAALTVETLAGDPPARVAWGGLELVFDGVLHNREQLRRPDARAGKGDAELALAAYRRHGADLVNQLEGRFALLVWDGERRELMCVRDPLGSYPLFWAARGDELLFSTGTEELLKQPGVSRALNRAVLAEHLCLRWTRPEETYHAAVQRVRPGHALRVADHGRRHAYRYWDPVPTPDSDDWIPEGELHRFDDLFERAVGRCLGSEQAGIFLSGGLDSGSVAAMAADVSRARGASPPLALSVSLPEGYSEETVQRGVAAQLGMPQVVVNYDAAVDPPGRLAAVLEASAETPAPLLSLWSPAYWCAAAEGRARGCEVILTGSGGDEVLVASPSLAADFIRRADGCGLWRLYKSMRQSFPWSVPQLLWGLLWTTGARMLLAEGARNVLGSVAPALLRKRWEGQIAAGTPPWVSPDEWLDRELVERGLSMAARPTRLSNFYYEDNRAQLDHASASLEMERVFEEGRRLGVRILEPFWDADLQEFLYRVPPLSLHESGQTKSLVRGMLARRFPELGFERQVKRLADELANHVMATEGPPLLAQMGGARTLSDLGLVDRGALDAGAARMASDPQARRRSYLVFRAIALEAWVRPRA